MIVSDKKVWITAYDIFSSRVSCAAGADCILVGDSLGMTVYGDDNTHSMTPEIMIRHFLAVKKESGDLPVVLDYPIGSADSFEKGKETFLYFQKFGVEMVKIEGGVEKIELFKWILDNGGDVVGHLGMQPQISEVRIHGRAKDEAQDILECINTLESIGVQNIVLECVPEELGKKAQEMFAGNIIGIGAGRYTNAQVLVFDDVVGRTDPVFTPRFLRRFGNSFEYDKTAVQDFVHAVKKNEFPGNAEVY